MLALTNYRSIILMKNIFIKTDKEKICVKCRNYYISVSLLLVITISGGISSPKSESTSVSFY